MCPTADRRRFLPRAIECFLAQSYEPRELIILDDGEDAAGDLALAYGDARVRYVRELPKRVLGPKRNRCAELAAGEIFVLWDDDDWHGPDRIAVQVAALENRIVSLLDRCLVQDEKGVVWDSSHAWFFPGTATMWREAWQLAPWPIRDVGADKEMLRALLASNWKGLCATVNGRDHYRVIRHDRHRTTLSMTGWNPTTIAPIPV